MERLLKEYNGWLADHKNFYEHLQSHQSALYLRFQPVYDVMLFLYNEYKDHVNDMSEDIEKIFQIGLEYIHMQFFTAEVYLEKTFNNDFHNFLEYDRVISYLLFLEDLKYELIEKSIDYDQEELEKLNDYLDEIIEERQTIPENLNLFVDSKVFKIINADDYHFTGIIDIFVEIADALGLSFDEENDVIIGEDL